MLLDDLAPRTPSKANRRWKSCFSRTLYKGRNAVERMFCRLKGFRRIATRYDKLAANFLGAVYFAAESGHVLLNRFGKPYTDTRDLEVQGGNPLKRAHDTACSRAGIEGFTVHDWRHHWASHCVMAGIDMPRIMRLGGWKSLQMIEPYAAVDTVHMKAAILKLI